MTGNITLKCRQDCFNILKVALRKKNNFGVSDYRRPNPTMCASKSMNPEQTGKREKPGQRGRKNSAGLVVKRITVKLFEGLVIANIANHISAVKSTKKHETTNFSLEAARPRFGTY